LRFVEDDPSQPEIGFASDRTRSGRGSHDDRGPRGAAQQPSFAANFPLRHLGRRPFTRFWRAIPGSPARHHDALRPIEIQQLSTAPRVTGKGNGAALMDRVMAEARSYAAEAIHLSIWSGNEGAQRFYARHGFARAADIEFWVGDRRVEELLSALAL
jgi:ribosomal protein S18 acetylase RimI-like enzyme